MDIQELRNQIDEIDNSLVNLFEKRMDISAEVARYKQLNNMPVYDPAREKEILDKLSSKVTKGRESSIVALYSLLFELSRAEQERIMNQEAE